MTYVKPSVEEIREEPVFAGACGSYSSSCGGAVHKRGARGGCGDYSSGCYQQVHKRTNTACGDYSSGCYKKVHKR